MAAPGYLVDSYGFAIDNLTNATGYTVISMGSTSLFDTGHFETLNWTKKVLTGNWYCGSLTIGGYSAVNSLQTGGLIPSGQSGSFVMSSQTGSFVMSSQTGSFVTKSQTGDFLTRGQSGIFKGLSLDVKNVTGSYYNYQLTVSNNTVLFSGTSLTGTLPSAALSSGNIFTLKNISPNTQTTVACSVSAKIDGSSSYPLNTGAYKYVSVQSDGTNYWVIANN